MSRPAGPLPTSQRPLIKWKMCWRPEVGSAIIFEGITEKNRGSEALPCFVFRWVLDGDTGGQWQPPRVLPLLPWRKEGSFEHPDFRETGRGWKQHAGPVLTPV